jgi:hypothetical protein
MLFAMVRILNKINQLAASLEPIFQNYMQIFIFLGSEKVKLSHSKGKQLVETNNINKSLLTLGKKIFEILLKN